MAANIVLEKKAQQWHEAVQHIVSKISGYSEEEQDSFVELLMLVDEDCVKPMMLTEKCKLLSVFANQISVKDSDLSTYVNQFVGICESIYSKPEKFKEFKSILKSKGWLKEVKQYKPKENNWQKEQEAKWHEEQRRKQYESQEKQRREEEQKRRERYKQGQKRYEYINPSPDPSGRRKKKKSKWWLWILFLGFLWAGYEFWFKDYLRDKDASRTYVYATNLFLRSSKDAESDNNRRGKIPYGTKLITYSNVDGWAEVKYDGETGYVSSDYLLEPNDFHLLDGVWGNEEAKEVVITSKCRMAILDYLKKNNWQTGTNAWQIYTKQKEMKPNSVLYPSLNDGYDDFSEFAFILTDNRTKKRTFVLYAFEKDETPIFRYMEEAPDKGDIRSVSYSKWNNKYRVVYSGQGNTYISDKNNETKPKVQSQSKDIEITKVMFANVDYDNKVIATYGAQLYQDTKYLKGKVDFKRGTDISGTMKFQIKILRPDGSMMRGNISPNGYTFEQNVSLSGNGGHFFTLGWGNNEGNIYSPGTYAYEIWYNGQKIYETTFVIENKTWGVETEKKNESKVGDDDEISQWAEQMPEFPGGMAALTNYVQNKIKYPSVAQKNGVQGRVVVSFVVEKDGSVLKANILKGVDPYLDKEALRVVLSMPKWKPAMQAGKKVRCKLTVPVNFKLTE